MFFPLSIVPFYFPDKSFNTWCAGSNEMATASHSVATRMPVDSVALLSRHLKVFLLLVQNTAPLMGREKFNCVKKPVNKGDYVSPYIRIYKCCYVGPVVFTIANALFK